VVGVLFKASPVILGTYGVLSYYNFLAHADVRLSFNGASWILNSPAYHRLHHSAAPEHANANYAALLPIFDLVSGVYRRPHPGEYPATGLSSGECPETLLGSVIWPWRNRRKDSQVGTRIKA
jgi:sterol desaturase/sphingolipid hydroxylase (fatty acid hydroxylase superfamily)